MKHEHVTTRCISKTVLAALAALFFSAGQEFAAGVTGVQFEAESGTLGANLQIDALAGALGGQVIVGTGTNPGGQPSTVDNLATYTVEFTTAGEYDLYIRFELTSNTGADSLLVAESFGEPSVTDAGLWALQNNLNTTNAKRLDIPVLGGGVLGDYAAGDLVWVNWSAAFTDPTIAGVQTDSDDAIPTYTVGTAGSQTFQISKREPGGVRVDALAFVLTSEAGDVELDGENNLNISADQAKNPSPANGEEFISVHTDLTWDDPDVSIGSPVTFDVYFGTDIPDANCDSTNPLIISGQDVNVAQNIADLGGPLAFETTYYWRVDVRDPNNGGTPFVVKGNCWSFTTAPSQPTILSDPQGLTVDKGAMAVFTVDQVGGTGFQWRKDGVNLSDGGKISGANTTTLTVTDVQLAEEGDYDVIVSNISGSATSAEANLITCRLVGHWKFENNLNDSVTDTEPGAPSFNGSVISAAISGADYAAGIDGMAYHFVGDPNTADPNSNSNVIEMLGTEDYYNFFTRGFTISAWINVAANPGAEAGIAAKQNEAATENDGFAFYTDQPNGEAEIDINTTNTRDTDVPVVDGVWHHVVAVYDAANGTLSTFLDGNDERENTGVNPPTASPGAPLVLGAQDHGGTNGFLEGQFIGLVDDVRIYSCPLKPTEVSALYGAVVGGYQCVIDNPEDDVAGFDFNQDCTVNLLDYALLADVYLDCYRIPASLCD